MFITILFLAVLAVLFVVGIFLTEMENFGWATVLLIAGLVCLHFVPGFGVWHWVQHHALETALYSLAYMAGGIVWSFVKWFSYLRSFRDKFREQKETFFKVMIARRQYLTDTSGRVPTIEINLSGPIPEDMKESFKTWMNEQHGLYYTAGDIQLMRDLKKPQASRNKSRIVAWMALWPLSLLGTFLNDPVRRLFNFLFSYFKTLYQKLVDHVLRNEVELK